jgi:hypothetical protein
VSVNEYRLCDAGILRDIAMGCNTCNGRRGHSRHCYGSNPRAYSYYGHYPAYTFHFRNGTPAWSCTLDLSLHWRNVGRTYFRNPSTHAWYPLIDSYSIRWTSHGSTGQGGLRIRVRDNCVLCGDYRQCNPVKFSVTTSCEVCAEFRIL